MSLIAEFFDKYEYKNGSLVDKVSEMWMEVVKASWKDAVVREVLG
jgi:hypothetical protein